ncbi:MAG: HAD family hydrolase [Deltaproteobacteria bacterium]|nr:HAD family hydrolase [Deltaproteobacteria bacterium]
MLHLKETEHSSGFPIGAVIFDLDGTLLDTREILFNVVERALESVDLPMVSREVLVEAASEGDFDWNRVLPTLSESGREEIIVRIRAVIGEIYPRLLKERATLIPGAARLLRVLSETGTKIALVTSTPKRYMDIKLRVLRSSGIEALFDVILGADDVEKKKPDPEPLLECARRLGIAPGECVYIGDMRMDIRAGKSAGMKTVGVLTGFDNPMTLEVESPDVIVDTVAVLGETFGLG